MTSRKMVPNERLHAAAFLPSATACPELVHAFDDVLLGTCRHFGVLVVLVHHRQVVEDIFCSWYMRR